MHARRRLPVLQPSPRAPAEAPAEAPPWHWIPLGSAVSLAALVPLAPLMLSAMRAVLRAAYPEGASAARLAEIRRGAADRAVAVELAASAVPVLSVLLCVALGGYVLGRRGARTNHRHGALSGACTAVLCAALSRSLAAALVLVPLAMAVGGLSARAGVRRRERSAQHEP